MLGEAAMFRSGDHAEAEAVLARRPRCARTDVTIWPGSPTPGPTTSSTCTPIPARPTAVLDEALAVITDELPRLRLLGRLATNRLFAGDPEGALAAAAPVLATDDDAPHARAATPPRSHWPSSAGARGGFGRLRRPSPPPPRHRHARSFPRCSSSARFSVTPPSGRFARAETDSVIGQDQPAWPPATKKATRRSCSCRGGFSSSKASSPGPRAMFVDGASVNREINDPPGLRWCLAGIALAEAMSGHADRATAAAESSPTSRPGPMTLYETDLIERSQAWVSASWVSCRGRARSSAQPPAGRRRPSCASPRPGCCTTSPGWASRSGLPSGWPNWPRTSTGVGAGAGPARRRARQLGRSRAEEARPRSDELGAACSRPRPRRPRPRPTGPPGRPARPVAAARRADELAAACGNVRARPALAAGHGNERLTRREREIAGLAAAGVSSRRDRRAALPVDPDRRQPSSERLRQARRHQPRGTRQDAGPIRPAGLSWRGVVG